MRRLIQALPVLLLCVACNAAFASAPPARADEGVESLMVMRVEGTLVVAPDGSVHKYEIGTPIDGGTKALLERTIPAWQFEPVVVDGKAQYADTRWHATLAGVRDGDELAVHVDNVLFLPTGEAKTPFPQNGAIDPKARQMNPPAFPRDLARQRLNARVVLALQYSPDGSVANVAATQSMLYDVRDNPKTTAKNLHQFELATVEAARKWRANTTRGPLSGAALSTFTSVDFTTSDAYSDPRQLDAAGTWHRVMRLRHPPQAWYEAGAAAPGVADFALGEVLPHAGFVRLLTPIQTN